MSVAAARVRFEETLTGVRGRGGGVFRWAGGGRARRGEGEGQHSDERFLQVVKKKIQDTSTPHQGNRQSREVDVVDLVV